jgi:hypothetical protein
MRRSNTLIPFEYFDTVRLRFNYTDHATIETFALIGFSFYWFPRAPSFQDAGVATRPRDVRCYQICW